MRTIFPEPLDEININLLRTGRWEGELIHAMRDGTRVVAASRWSLQRDERGNPTAILETNNNITERKQAEEALRRSRDELEIKVKERTGELRKMNTDLHSVNKELEAFAYSVSTICARRFGILPDSPSSCRNTLIPFSTTKAGTTLA